MAGSLQLQQFGLKGSESAGAQLTQAGQRSLDRQEQGLDRLSREMMQLRTLDAHQQQQQKQIDAQAALQKQSAEHAYKVTAIKAGLDERVAEREFDNRLKEIQAKAKAEAMQFDYEFTTEQRSQIAKYQNVLQEVEHSDTYSPEEKQTIRTRLLADMAGVTPMAIPAKGPKLPDWADPLGISLEPNSGLAGTFENRNGKLNFKPLPKELQQSYQQYAIKLKEAESSVKRQEQMLEYINKPIKGEDGERPPTWEEQASRRNAWRNSMYFSDMLERKPDDQQSQAHQPQPQQQQQQQQQQQPKSRGMKQQQPKQEARPPMKMDELEQSVAAGEIVKVKSKDQYDKLPSGAQFIAPDGFIWVKK